MMQKITGPSFYELNEDEMKNLVGSGSGSMEIQPMSTPVTPATPTISVASKVVSLLGASFVGSYSLSAAFKCR